MTPIDRNHYKIFSEGCIAGLTISNRLIRSATWDPSILNSRQMADEVLELYRNIALGGVGAIITGGFPVYREHFPEEDSGQPIRLYADPFVVGLLEGWELARVVRFANIVGALSVTRKGPMEGAPYRPEVLARFSVANFLTE